MTSEEIRALSLREGDVADLTVRVEVGRGSLTTGYSTPSMLMDVGDTPGTVDIEEGVRGVLSFSFPDECIRSIERVMPQLPEGWTRVDCVRNQGELALVMNGTHAVLITIHGNLSGFYTDQRGENKAPIPALVAKALIDVWGRTR